MTGHVGVQSVLVLEDHDFQREVAVALLKDCGVLRVFSSSDGDAALEITRLETIDVVVCDLQTPGMDGVELIRHIAKEGLAQAVIIASALDVSLIGTVEEMARAYGVQVLGAVEKPLSRRKLHDMLQRFRPRSAAASAPSATTVVSLEDISAGLRAGEFMPYFQPKIAVRSGRCQGVEALCRWQHHERGMISPLAFIPVAENTPVIHDITWMMLEKSLLAWKSWGRDAWSLSISVNFSADVLSDPDVVQRIAAETARHRVEPCHIVLEVTESVLTKNTGQMLEALARLRLKGFGISIDDFGTGYSSMQQLSRISFTELKIDRSFVHGASRRRHLRTILESSLELARKLRLHCVAEGVETAEDWDLLDELGCDLAQGYYKARPMPSDDFRNWHARTLTDCAS